MFRNKKKILSIVFVFVTVILSAQNDPLITNYMFTPSSINPALVGNDKSINALLLVREQWVGFNEAPSTQLVNFDTKIDRLGGIGFSIMNDKLGFEQSLKMKLLYSNQIAIDEVSSVFVGGGFGLVNKSLDATNLTYASQNDVNGIYANQSEFLADFDFGTMYKRNDLRIGLSSTHLLVSKNNSTFFNVPRHFYLFADYKKKLSDRIDAIPSVLFKTSVVRKQLEIGSLFMVDKKYWAGFSFRNNEALSLLIGMNFMKYYSFGYSYDFNIGSVNGYSSGSHEFFIRLNIIKPEKIYKFYKSPRYFN